MQLLLIVCREYQATVADCVYRVPCNCCLLCVESTVQLLLIVCGEYQATVADCM